MKRHVYVFNVINELSKKYDLDLRNMRLPHIKKQISKQDWNRLHHAVKFGKEVH
jgi:hypothetical protein